MNDTTNTKIAMLMAMGGASHDYAARALDDCHGNVNRAMEQVYGDRNKFKTHHDSSQLERHRKGDNDSAAAQPESHHSWTLSNVTNKKGSYRRFSAQSPNSTPQANNNTCTTSRNHYATALYPGAIAVHGPDATSFTSDEEFSSTSRSSLAHHTRTGQVVPPQQHSIYPVTTARLVEDDDVDVLHEQIRQQEDQLEMIRTEQENAAARLDRILADQENGIIVAHVMDDDDESTTRNNKQSNCGPKQKWCVAIFATLIIVGAAVGAVLGLVVFPPDPTPSSTDPYLTALLSPLSFDGGAALQTPFTPQNKALQWLSGDEHVANLEAYPDEKIIQRYVLATFYYSTNGAAWTRNDGWLSNDDECTWYSQATKAFCSQGAVARLVFYDGTESGNNLVGSIPVEIALLSSSLERLDLGNNTLTGTIPSEIGLLTGLRESLGLERNSLTGTLPPEIGELTAMEHELRIYDNVFLMGSIPSEIGLLTAMTSLFLSGQSLTGPIPSEIGLLTSMDQLYLNGNQITGTIPTEIGLLSTMESDLTLDSNSLKGSIPSEIGRLTALDGMWLKNNQLTGTIPLQIHSMTSLKSLRLYNNTFSGQFTCPEFINDCLISCKDESNEACGSL